MQGTDDAGFVEIYLFGHWRKMCGDNFDILDAVVVCRELGYLTAVATRRFNGFTRAWPYGFACTGHESTLKQCTKAYKGYCVYEQAFVSCSSE